MEGSPFHTAGTQRHNKTLYSRLCWWPAYSLTLLKVEPGSASKGGGASLMGVGQLQGPLTTQYVEQRSATWLKGGGCQYLPTLEGSDPSGRQGGAPGVSVLRGAT